MAKKTEVVVGDSKESELAVLEERVESLEQEVKAMRVKYDAALVDVNKGVLAIHATVTELATRENAVSLWIKKNPTALSLIIAVLLGTPASTIYGNLTGTQHQAPQMQVPLPIQPQQLQPQGMIVVSASAKNHLYR